MFQTTVDKIITKVSSSIQNLNRLTNPVFLPAK